MYTPVNSASCAGRLENFKSLLSEPLDVCSDCFTTAEFNVQELLGDLLSSNFRTAARMLHYVTHQSEPLDAAPVKYDNKHHSDIKHAKCDH